MPKQKRNRKQQLRITVWSPDAKNKQQTGSTEGQIKFTYESFDNTFYEQMHVNHATKVTKQRDNTITFVSYNPPSAATEQPQGEKLADTQLDEFLDILKIVEHNLAQQEPSDYFVCL